VTVSARFQPEQKFEISEKGYKAGQTTQEDSKRTTTDNRQEENDLTIARAAHAKAVVLELKQNLQELNVVAPVDGEVAQIYIDRGELASPGAALITILDLSEVWVTANLREDLLVRFPMGGSLKGKVPALGDKQVEFKVTSIFLLQDLAHVTTKIDNHADFRIFKVRAVPTQPTEGLRPGMSVLFEVPNSSSALSKAQ
jgi:HlyD family secretion protein